MEGLEKAFLPYNGVFPELKCLSIELLALSLSVCTQNTLNENIPPNPPKHPPLLLPCTCTTSVLLHFLLEVWMVPVEGFQLVCVGYGHIHRHDAPCTTIPATTWNTLGVLMLI